jgi:hypothetical protein
MSPVTRVDLLPIQDQATRPYSRAVMLSSRVIQPNAMAPYRIDIGLFRIQSAEPFTESADQCIQCLVRTTAFSPRRSSRLADDILDS